MSPHPSLIGTTLDGKLRLEKALASGASGDVYEALHLGLGTKVAVKVLRPGVPETADLRRKRFMREARVAARIESDHVVRVLDIVAPERGPTYIVMELLQGETLAEKLARVGPLPIAQAVEYVQQAAIPLAEMHDAGIVHRDVKPSNIFLARGKNGAKDKVKLIDFGVAAFRSQSFDEPPRGNLPSRAESSLTLAEAVIGTPRYMAPEQIQASKDVDGRADVWALGVTLYVLLSGKPPFDAGTPLALMSQIQQVEPPPLASKRPEVPGGLAEVVHRCLAKDRAARPHDARALAALLAPFVSEGELGLSTQGVAIERLQKNANRRRRAVWTATLGVAVGAGIAVFLAMQGGSAPAAARVAAPLESAFDLATIAPRSAAVAAREPPSVEAAPAPPPTSTTSALSVTVISARPRASAPPRVSRPAPRTTGTDPPHAATTAKPRRLPDDDRIE